MLSGTDLSLARLWLEPTAFSWTPTPVPFNRTQYTGPAMLSTRISAWTAHLSPSLKLVPCTWCHRRCSLALTQACRITRLLDPGQAFLAPFLAHLRLPRWMRPGSKAPMVLPPTRLLKFLANLHCKYLCASACFSAPSKTHQIVSQA